MGLKVAVGNGLKIDAQESGAQTHRDHVQRLGGENKYSAASAKKQQYLTKHSARPARKTKSGSKSAHGANRQKSAAAAGGTRVGSPQKHQASTQQEHDFYALNMQLQYKEILKNSERQQYYRP